MKILFVIKNLASAVGGAERVLCTVCSELVTRGHNISVVTFDQPGGEPFYPLDEKVKRIDLGIGDSIRPARMGETLCRMKAIRQVCMAEQPDVAVGFMHSMFIPLAFALAGSSITVLGSEHIVPRHYRTRPLQYVLLTFAALFLSKITVLSESIRERYPYLVRHRMVTIPNPVVSAPSAVGIGSLKETFSLLSVGRLDPQKDHDTLLRAFSQIAQTFPDWNLRIIGEGSLRLYLEQLVDTLGLKARVTMPGVIAEISTEYLSADAFVISSRYESFGLVTAEAMSHGLPVVGFADCPGTNELIEGGETGLLVNPGNNRVNALAEALSRLLADPKLRRQLGDVGQHSIDERFSPEYVGDLWEKFLCSASTDKG